MAVFGGVKRQKYVVPNFKQSSARKLRRHTVAEAYCVKCKAKKEMANAQEVTMKNGRPAIQGVCPDCGTKLFRIMGGEKKK